ncbi:MAG: PKD domain-containing protein [Candidatus Auribacterota bacterium]
MKQIYVLIAVFLSCLVFNTIPASCYTDAPAGEVSCAFSEIYADEGDTYVVTARYYSPSISYCFLRMSDSSRINYPTLMMRIDSGFNKVWVTTFVESYLGGSRDTSSIFLSDYNNTTVTKLYDTNGIITGIEVQWSFKLVKDTDSPYADANGYWFTPDSAVNFGVFLIGETEVGYNDSPESIYYSTGTRPAPPVEASNGTRSLFVWRQTINIINSIDARNEFFSFIEAPHGNPQARINTLYMALYTVAFNGDAQSAVRSFISDAHSRGVKVYFLSGDPAWALLYYRPYAANHLNNVFQYNLTASSDERIDGILFDVEPHILSGWPNDAIWHEYINNMEYYQSLVQAHNASANDSLTFGGVITFWYDEHIYLSRPVNQYIQDITDFIAILNYRTNDSALSVCDNEISYADSIGKTGSVHTILETMNLFDADPYNLVTFWNIGNDQLELMINSLDTLYAATPSYAGAGIHYYETDATTEESYRQLRPTQTADPNQPFSHSPVCTILTPNSGTINAALSWNISYSAYDPDTADLQITFSALSDENEIPLGSEIISKSVSSVTAEYTVNPALYPIANGTYRIKAVITELLGDPLSSTDYSDSAIVVASVSAPIADAGGPYASTEGSVITLTALNSVNPDGGTLQYLWDLNADGVFETSGATPSIARQDDASISVTLRVTNANNLSDTDTAVVTFLNAAPVLSLPASASGLVNETLAVSSVTYSDAGADTHTASINWGDGTAVDQFSVSNGTIPCSHVYANAGNYIITVTVTDDDGAIDVAECAVTITDQQSGISPLEMLDDAITFAETIRVTNWKIRSNIVSRLQNARTYLVAGNIPRTITVLQGAITYMNSKSSSINSEDRAALTVMINNIIAELQ